MKKVGITRGAFYERFFDIVRELGAEPKKVNGKKDLKDLSLLILTGGSDIHPALYGQRNTHSIISQFSLARDVFEKDMLASAIKSGLKVLGICRGHQLINACLGGKLLQEVAIIQKHPLLHKLNSPKGMVKAFFEEVNSIHHQGVITPGEGLIPTSTFGGVIESTESEDIFSVQWHPESMETFSSIRFFDYIINDWS